MGRFAGLATTASQMGAANWRWRCGPLVLKCALSLRHYRYRKRNQRKGCAWWPAVVSLAKNSTRASQESIGGKTDQRPAKRWKIQSHRYACWLGLHWLVCNQRLGLCFRIEDLRNSRWSALWSDYRCGERSCHQRSDPILLNNNNKRLARGFTPLQMTRAKRPTERICWSCLYVEDVVVVAHGRNIEEVRRMVQSFVGAYRMRLVKDASKWILQTSAWARIFNREPIFQVTVGTTPL